MPKLAAKVRKRVDKAEANTGEFKPLAPGKYVATLSEVEVTKSAGGDPMWRVVFEDLHDLDGDRQPGRQWYNLMIPLEPGDMPEDYAPRNSKKSPQEAWNMRQSLAEGRMKAFFEAFGFTTDSDTDEMIGDKVIVQIGVRTISKGAKAGQQTNDVNAVLPLDSVDGAGDIGDGDGGKGDDNF